MKVNIQKILEALARKGYCFITTSHIAPEFDSAVLVLYNKHHTEGDKIKNHEKETTKLFSPYRYCFLGRW